MGKFMLQQTAAGYSFNLEADNHEIILRSEVYTSKAGCLAGIASVRENVKSDDNFERLRSGDHLYYFNLKAANGEIIGSSETYTSVSSREKGIESVKLNAPKAVVEE